MTMLKPFDSEIEIEDFALTTHGDFSCVIGETDPWFMHVHVADYDLPQVWITFAEGQDLSLGWELPRECE